MAIREHLSTWAGFNGAPGTTVMYSTDEAGFKANLDTFWTAISGQLPQAVSIVTSGTGKVIDEVDGKTLRTFDEGAGTNHTGQIDDHFSSLAGAVLAWHTGAWVNGREVVGKTYIVPAPSSVFDKQGYLLQAAANAYRDAGQALINNSGQRFVIWARPFEGREAQGERGSKGYKKAIAPRTGTFHVVKTCTCHIQGTSLRKRRDQ